MWFETDKDFKHETLFDEDIFSTVTDMVQHEDDPQKVDTVKILHTGKVKAQCYTMLTSSQQFPWLNLY